MIRITFTILACIVVSSLFGQFYLQPTVGYTFSSHPEEIQNTIIIDWIKSTYKTQIKNGSGLHVGLDFGYKHKSNLFTELMVKQSVYTKGKCSVEKLSEFNSHPSLSYISDYFGEEVYNSAIFQISPVVGYLMEYKKLGLYFKLGPNFMHVSTTKELNYKEYENLPIAARITNFPIEKSKQMKLSGKLHAGLQANLGATYQWKDNWAFVVDIVNVYNNYKYTKAETTKYEANGNDLLDTIEDTSSEPNEYSNRVNFSYFGINMGVRYVLGKSAE